jgi:hypothetical protein
MIYYQTKDVYYVKDFLGRKDIRNADIYVNVERTMFEPSSDEFTARVTDKPEDIKAFLETGFEYVCQKDDLVYLRKHK